MQDGVLNLCRVKLRDQQRLEKGPLKEYSQFGEDIPFGEATPRAGNDSGGGQPGQVDLKVRGEGVLAVTVSPIRNDDPVHTDHTSGLDQRVSQKETLQISS